MAASSAHKMTAACAVLVILLSTAAQPAMAILPNIGSQESPIVILSGIAYYFTAVNGLVYLLPAGQCTKEPSVCFSACCIGCDAFAVHVVCNSIICQNEVEAAACAKRFHASCTTACDMACKAIPGN